MPGPNGLPNSIFKAKIDRWTEILTPLFNDVVKTKKVPDSWQGSIIQPIYKSGPQENPENYRLIALTDVKAKVFSSCLLSDLEEWATKEDLIPTFQTWFRRGESTSKNLTVLTLLAERAKYKKQKLYICFVDLKAAFESVPRNLLWAKLSAWGISNQLLDMIKLLYTNAWVQVKVGDGRCTTRQLETSSGLKQGCVLAPFLFNLFMADLPSHLKDVNAHSPIFSGQEIKYLQYADDNILLSHTAIGLRRLVDSFNIYISVNGLQMNTKKTKIMTIGGTKLDKSAWKINGLHIETVKFYKYLGITFDDRLSFKQHFINQKAKATALSFAFRKLRDTLAFPNHEHLLKIMKAKLIPSLTYGTVIFRGKDSKSLDSLQIKVFKSVFKVPKYIGHANVRLEFGLKRQTLTRQSVF